MDEQLRLGGMPAPRADAPPPPEGSAQDAQALLDNPDAAADDLLQAFTWSSLPARLRDTLLLHPAILHKDLERALDEWTGALRDRALAVTDDVLVLQKHAQSPSPHVRAIVAMNPACPADLALRLSEDPHPGVRGNAACCPNLPKAQRLALANRDPDPEVREFVHWLVTTTDGAELIAGARYTALRDAGEHDAHSVGRIVSYGMGALGQAPV